MKYEIDLYETDEGNQSRFALGKTGNNPLIAVGLNPSTADDQKPDQSISKLIGFATRNGFDGFVMLNLYPQRTPYPEKIHRRRHSTLHIENLQHIGAVLEQQKALHVLAAWGSIIHVRPWLGQCLKDINTLAQASGAQWMQIGTGTAAGHPRHPSRASYRLSLCNFDISAYLHTLAT